MLLVSCLPPVVDDFTDRGRAILVSDIIHILIAALQNTQNPQVIMKVDGEHKLQPSSSRNFSRPLPSPLSIATLITPIKQSKQSDVWSRLPSSATLFSLSKPRTIDHSPTANNLDPTDLTNIARPTNGFYSRLPSNEQKHSRNPRSAVEARSEHLSPSVSSSNHRYGNVHSTFLSLYHCPACHDHLSQTVSFDQQRSSHPTHGHCWQKMHRRYPWTSFDRSLLAMHQVLRVTKTPKTNHFQAPRIPLSSRS